MSALSIRLLGRKDAESYWHLRLEALERELAAFHSSAGEHQETPIAALAERLSASHAGNFVVGAFDGDRLIGVAGFAREQRAKLRHKGHIWGVYVSGDARGRGVGRALITGIVDRVRQVPGIHSILLSVSVSQSAARALYRSLGFEVMGREPDAVRWVTGGGLQSVDEETMLLRLHESAGNSL